MRLTRRRPPDAVEWRRLPARALGDDADLRRDWDALNARSGDVPVLASPMVTAALEHLASGRERLLVGRRAGTVVAMAVMAPDSPLGWSTFQPSQMPLGALVVAPDEDLAQLGASLLNSSLAPALVVSFTQVDPQFVARAADSPTVRHDDYVRTAWVEVAGDFETYWAQRGKNLRQNLRKQRNRLAADSRAVAMRVWREPQQMAAALERYGALESRGWKAAGGTAIHADNAQGRFYRALFEAAAARGEALVCEYVLDDRTVAMNLCIHRAGTLVILKTTYDESVKPMSPAFLLQEELLQSVFESGSFRRVEYYGRMMEWHTRWTESSRVLFHVTVFRWRLARWLAERRRRRAVPAQAAAPDSPGQETADEACVQAQLARRAR